MADSVPLESIALSDRVSWVGASDPNLRVFDIVMYTEFGTTYNSYIVKCGDEAVLIETVKGKTMHTDQLLGRIEDVMGGTGMKLTHIILNHTEPDHSSTAVQLALATGATIHGTVAAINFLKEISNDNTFKRHQVKKGDVLSVNGTDFHFHLAPWLHWGDTMFTHVPSLETVFSCDFLGAHYACPH
ncbi:hypothetical protein KIPB_004722, partial [Kipferlia bialata]|eukprot:g4722.t1